jgi:hypothetical protein
MRVSELTQRYRPREGHIDVSTIYTNILYDDPAQNLRIESVLSDRSIPSGLTATKHPANDHRRCYPMETTEITSHANMQLAPLDPHGGCKLRGFVGDFGQSGYTAACGRLPRSTSTTVLVGR